MGKIQIVVPKKTDQNDYFRNSKTSKMAMFNFQHVELIFTNLGAQIRVSLHSTM